MRITLSLSEISGFHGGVSVMRTVFWDAVLCSFIETKQCFRDDFGCYHQGIIAFLNETGGSTKMHGATLQETVIYNPVTFHKENFWCSQ
jgi:hypothetical protein